MKLRIIPMVVALCCIFCVVTSAGAAREKMTSSQKVAFLKKRIKHDRDVIAFFHKNPRLLSSNNSLTRLIALREIRVHAKHLRWMTRTLIRTERTSLFPPHHLLWLCIHGTPSLGTPIGHEASTWNNHDTGHNGHYGGLQMHWDWGYGISGDAGNYTEAEQEWAAEKGFKASGYNSSFLWQQWGQTVGPCIGYA